ncbi:hypothetical protein KP79_PYT24580 [Mizuhopecten yessoensis]|uniref:Uncharacterized protein n=1 Tax=Mizuhopecten yessoensis TaxID=6573 RepID=A0A210QP69_MIZYE|nr:hypothetical protein KP79_PYT24580 [Mizuhopecten yessoensis]
MELQERESDLLTLNEQHDISPKSYNVTKSDCSRHKGVLQPLTSPVCPSKHQDEPHICHISNSPKSTRMNGKVFSSQPPTFLGLALIVALCNFPFGCTAVVCALLSKKKYQEGDIKGAKGKGQAAKWLSIIGFVTFLVLVLFVLIYKFVILPNVIDTINWGNLDGEVQYTHGNETYGYEDIH